MTWSELIRVVLVGELPEEADIQQKDETSIYRSSALHFAVVGGNCEAVQVLLEAGLSPNQRNCYGETALHWACKLDQPEMVKMFIRYGGEVDLSDAEGNTPLHWAAEYDQLGIAKILLNLGASPDLRNDRNLTPCQLARLEEVSAPTCNILKQARLENLKNKLTQSVLYL